MNKTKGLLTVRNTKRGMYDEVEELTGNVGQVAILKTEYLTSEYRKPEYQLFRLQSGFGCQPDSIGNACFGYFCADGENCRMEKYEFIGIADEATVKFAEELERKWQREPKKAV